MPYYLRKISISKWRQTYDWLDDDDVPSDVFSDIKTDKSELSVWYVDDIEKTLFRVISAMALTGSKIDNFDCILINTEIIERNFNLQKWPGNSPDNEVNDWHRNINFLSGESLLFLAKMISLIIKSDEQVYYQFMPEKVAEMITSCIDNKFINEDALLKFKEDQRKRYFSKFYN